MFALVAVLGFAGLTIEPIVGVRTSPNAPGVA
jgi:hypothetical protein